MMGVAMKSLASLVSLVSLATVLCAGSAAAQETSDTTPQTPQELELERLRARADLLEQQQRIATAQLQLRTTLVDSVPASSRQGNVDTGDGAGEPEATVLAAAETRRAARRIVEEVAALNGGAALNGEAIEPTGSQSPTGADELCVSGRASITPQPAPAAWIVVLAGDAELAQNEWRQFNARHAALLRQLCNVPRTRRSGSPDWIEWLNRGQVSSIRPNDLSANAGGSPTTRYEGNYLSSMSAPIAAVQIAHAVFSYLASDYSVEGVTVSGVTDDMLVSAILEAGRNYDHDRIRFIAPAFVGTSAEGFSAFEIALRNLDDARNQIEPERRTCVVRRREAEARVNARLEADRPALRARENEDLRDCDIVEAAVAAHASFAADYGGSEQAAARSMRVIEQLSLALRMGDGARMLVVNVHSSDGSAYTQQNLWTHLGGMPFHITASVVVSWRLTDGSGMATHGGVLPMYSEYTRMRDIPDRLE